MFKMRNPIWLTALIKRKERIEVGWKEKSKKSNLESVDDRGRGGSPITIPNWIHYVITRVVTSLTLWSWSAGIESILQPGSSRRRGRDLIASNPFLDEKEKKNSISNKLIDENFFEILFEPDFFGIKFNSRERAFRHHSPNFKIQKPFVYLSNTVSLIL